MVVPFKPVKGFLKNWVLNAGFSPSVLAQDEDNWSLLLNSGDKEIAGCCRQCRLLTGSCEPPRSGLPVNWILREECATSDSAFFWQRGLASCRHQCSGAVSEPKPTAEVWRSSRRYSLRGVTALV